MTYANTPRDLNFTPDPESGVSTAVAARRLNVAPKKITEMVRNGTLKGGRGYATRGSIEKYLRNRGVRDQTTEITEEIEILRQAAIILRDRSVPLLGTTQLYETADIVALAAEAFRNKLDDIHAPSFPVQQPRAA